jgi:hypothetical protein
MQLTGVVTLAYTYSQAIVGYFAEYPVLNQLTHLRSSTLPQEIDGMASDGSVSVADHNRQYFEYVSCHA